LSIGTRSEKQVASSVRWSVGEGSDYSNLTFASVTIASGTLSTEAADARVYLQSVSQKSTADRDDATVVLTMVAP
jgi:hypothetical protein